MIIGVLFGGSSVEHDISILSAIQVMKVIDQEKYQIVPLYLTTSGLLLTGERFKDLATFKKKLTIKQSECVNIIRKNNESYLSHSFRKFKKWLKIDLILPIMHGKGVEDGNISGYLEILKVPYISSKVMGASIAQDKEITKIILEKMKINVIPYEVYINKDYKLSQLEYPLIIKPAKLGSSIGIQKVNNDEEYFKAINNAFKYDNKVIVEKCLTDFKEFSIACYEKKEQLVLSDIEELKLSSDIYRFTDKYQNGEKSEASNHQLPACIGKDLKHKIKEITKSIYRKFELSGVIRVDFLYDNIEEKLFVNEINTIPGSLAFYLFDQQGITFKDLIDDLIKQTLINELKNKEYLQSFESSILVNNSLNSKK